MGGVFDAIGNAVGDVAGDVGSLIVKGAQGLGSLAHGIAPALPEIGGAVGGYFGGPWGAAAGSTLGEALAGGNLKQDVTAGALSYAGGELSGLGGAAGAAGSDAASGVTDINSLYGGLNTGANGYFGDVLTGGGAGAAGGGATSIGDLYGGLNTGANEYLGNTFANPVTTGGGTGAPTAPTAPNLSPTQISIGQPAPTSIATLYGGVPNPVASGGSAGALSPLPNAGTAGAVAPLSATTSAAGAVDTGTGGILQNAGSDILNFIKKNPGTAAQLLGTAYAASHKPSLPGSLKSLQSTELANVQSAQGVINSGGQSSPNWQAQKTTIDQTIDQQVQQATQALLQRAANSGLDPNSMVVQQQIAQLTQQATTQKNQLYQQALQQNVNEAMSLLSGGSQTLTQIGNTQLQQDQQAQNLIAQLAGGALKSYSLQGQTPQGT